MTHGYYGSANAGIVDHINAGGPCDIVTTFRTVPSGVVPTGIDQGKAKAKKIVHVSSTYNVLEYDTDIIVGATAAPINIQFPSASQSNGRVIHVKREAGGFLVTVVPNGVDLIEGSSSLLIKTRGEAVSLTSDGLTWRVM